MKDICSAMSGDERIENIIACKEYKLLQRTKVVLFVENESFMLRK